MSVGGGRFGSVKSAAQGGGKTGGKTAGKAVGKTAGKLRTARRLGTDAALAISGDPRAIAKLAGQGGAAGVEKPAGAQAGLWGCGWGGHGAAGGRGRDRRRPSAGSGRLGGSQLRCV